MDMMKHCIALAKAMQAEYVLKDREVTYEEIFSDHGLLPAIAKRADQLCSLCLGYGIGATFEEKAQSMLGTTVTFDDLTPQAIRLLCITDVMVELMQNKNARGRVILDELLYD